MKLVTLLGQDRIDRIDLPNDQRCLFIDRVLQCAHRGWFLHKLPVLAERTPCHRSGSNALKSRLCLCQCCTELAQRVLVLQDGLFSRKAVFVLAQARRRQEQARAIGCTDGRPKLPNIYFIFKSSKSCTTTCKDIRVFTLHPHWCPPERKFRFPFPFFLTSFSLHPFCLLAI